MLNAARPRRRHQVGPAGTHDARRNRGRSGLALLISFVALAALWREPRFSGGSGRPLPPAVDAALSSTALRVQYPLLASMVGLTVGAVGLVFAA